MSTGLLYTTLAVYLACTFCYLLALVTQRPKAERLGHILLLPAILLHIASLVVRYVQAGYTPITNIHESLSFLSLAIAGFFFYIKRMYQVRALGSVVLPLVCILHIWSFFFPTRIGPLTPALNSWWLPVHVISSFLGNAAFFIALLVSILYLVIEGEIKGKKRLTVSEKFPSLETLDRINARCITYGFPFLTMGIITGSIWAGFAWGSYWSWDPKETWSLITWIAYAIVIHNRFTIGWRGKKTAYMMILGFCFILITFLGVNFILKGLHTYV